MFNSLFHWFLTVTGSNNTSGTWYGFWSGFGSDLTEFALLGTVIGLFRHHNCHVKGCFRIGHHPVEGTNYKTCHKHLTKEDHDKLSIHHAKHHPEQHKMLNKPKKK